MTLLYESNPGNSAPLIQASSGAKLNLLVSSDDDDLMGDSPAPSSTAWFPCACKRITSQRPTRVRTPLSHV